MIQSCYLCGSDKRSRIHNGVRDDKSIGVWECLECGLVYLDSHKTNEVFYKEGKMHDKRIQMLVGGNLAANDEDAKRRYEFVKNMIACKEICDFGSGYGGFLTLAKEVADSVCGVELESQVAPVYEREQIPLYASIEDTHKNFDVITSFHCLEHLANPIEFLKTFKWHLKKGGKIILEVPNANDALLRIYKSEAFADFTYWSAHLYLFTPHTLEKLAKLAGLKVEFIKCVQRYPLSNHLYWLSHNKPAGHKVWGEFLDNELLKCAYEQTLASLGASDTLFALLSAE